jgi:hypothetical protein
MSGRTARRGRAGDERGAIAVETALVSLLLVTIMSGVIEASMLFKDSYSISSAARGGARLGSSEPVASTFAQDTAGQVANALRDLDPTRVQAIWVYKASQTTGLPTSGTSCTSSCLKYTLNSSGAPVLSSGSWTGRSACAGGTVDAVGVYVEYRHRSLFGRFFNNQIIAERAIMSLEALPSSTACVSA